MEKVIELFLVYNLMTKDIKSVYKLENKKSYLFGLLDQKLIHIFIDISIFII